MQVLVADDHGLFREMLAKAIKELSDSVEVLHAGDLARTLDLARAGDKIDLILLDLRMPGMNGLAGLKLLRDARPDVPVVILSGETDPDVIRASLQAGSAGFIPKTTRVAAMVNALRLVLSGEPYIPPAALPRGAPGEKPTPAGLDMLTPRERDVLRQLIGGHSNKEIGHRLRLEEVTVAVHLRAIFRKLGVKNRTQAVRAALRLGMDA
jgi:two-component system, NarL family, nitrate/nitrite response regulator NarL